MNNKDLLKEGFFSDNFGGKKKKSSFPEYTPVDRNNPYGQGIGAVDTRNVKELKKRLEGGLGAVIGNNTVKNMANRAIKTFPIVISENVDPNTAVMLKNYLEQQYAEYINLLVSNQVIDITDYSRDNSEGNIAIQALDKITGADFSKQKIANKAMNNSLSANDLFGNNPVYRLLRQESFKCGDPALDSLLEDAMIVDSNNVNKIINILNEDKNGDPETDDPYEKRFNALFGDAVTDKSDIYNLANDKNPFLYTKNNTYSKYTLAQNQYSRSTDKTNIETLQKNGFTGIDSKGYEKYDKFTNGEIAIDPRLLSNAINREIGEVLSQTENKVIKDRYIDASYLLYSRFISGLEFLDYVTKRLGIPVRNDVVNHIENEYPATGLRSFDDYAGYNPIDSEDEKEVKSNKRKIQKYTEQIMSVKVADVLKYSKVGFTTGGIISIGSAISLCAAISLPIWPIALITGAGAGIGAGIGALIAHLRNKKKTKKEDLKTNSSRYKPWEKVEAMIDQLNAQREKVKNKYITVTDKDLEEIENKDLRNKIQAKLINNQSPTKNVKLENILQDFTDDMNRLFENAEFNGFEDKLGVAYKPLNEEDLMINKDVYEALCECFEENKNMNEAYDRISLIKPSEIIKARREMGVNVVNYDPDNTMMLPSYGARSQQAYGSVEYDRRELKDRRFNTPLILTVKFKERYSDGKYSDNELTAVIGILGVITRIPSEEMEYILKANAEGSTIKGFLSGDDKGSIGDIIAAFKKNRIDSSKLPQSAEVWKNLEKVSQLAVANKLAGKSSNSVANAHIIFSQKEADSVRQELGIDYLRDRKLSASLMKRYSAMNLMVANDALERVFVFNDMDSLSWDVIPYDALRNKDSSELATLKNLLR